MRIRWYILAMIALICAGLTGILLLIPPAQVPPNDTVAINDLRHRLAQDFERIRTEGAVALPALDGSDAGAGTAGGDGVDGSARSALAYSVFDADGRLLAATDEGLAEDLNEAIGHRDTIVDIVEGTQVMGKLVVNNNTATSLNEYRAQVRAVAVAVLILFALVSALLLWRVRRRILTPFHRLESFASSIAAGNLDIPLAMDRANVFGAFTESFDLMRSELAAAREGERRATQSKKELAAQLSHDIRSPVASIKAVSELMQVSKVDAASRERAAIIEAKADQIDLLVSNMLNATLEELTELVISPTETPSSAIASLIERADYRRLLRGSADDATGGAASAVVVPPCLVTADPIRLEQTLDNIINNSYKYAGTPIAFEAEILDCYLWLSFTDAGPGVSPDELPLLTQKFYRGANAAAKSGSGLGLYIANAFMARMDGSLTCENTTQGFRITLTLRLV